PFLSGGEAEVKDVAVLHHVILPFEPELARVARAGLTGKRHIIIIGNGLGADEALLEIGMDDAGGLWGASALGHGPGPRFLWPGGEIGNEPQELIALADEAVQAGFGEPKLGEVGLPLVGGELGKLRLDLGRDDDAAGALGLGQRLDASRMDV